MSHILAKFFAQAEDLCACEALLLSWWVESNPTTALCKRRLSDTVQNVRNIPPDLHTQHNL